MSKTFKDSQEARYTKTTKASTQNNGAKLHEQYIAHKREKALVNALRSADVDTILSVQP